MMVSKGITLLEKTEMSNKNIREWRRQTTDQNTWTHYNIFFRQYHCKQSRAVTTAGKGQYTAAVQNIYGVPPPPAEEHNGKIDNLHTITQGIQTHSYEMEGLSQDNAVLTRSNSAVMEQLEHITVTMNNMQAQLKTLASDPTNQTRSNRKYYYWSCESNCTHGIKT